MQITTPGVLYDFADCALTEEERMAAVSASDALIRCINRFARVDLTFMSTQSGIAESELISTLAGKAIFQNPAVFADSDTWNEDDGWLLASQYLCGNILEKLRIAKQAHARFGRFERNIRALEKLVPNQIDASEIRVSLGATWVPAEYYHQFICSLLEIKRSDNLSVIFNKEMSVFVLAQKDDSMLKHSVLNNYTYGTPDMPALKIIEHTLNAKTAKVYDYAIKRSASGGLVYEAVLNQEKTVAAQEKQELILERFQDWVHADAKRMRTLCDLYHDRYVGYTFTPFDGSFLDLADLNPEITPYPYQKNTIARILLSDGNLLLAQDVGSGKTYEMVCGVHELYRTGLSRRNLIVVPNSVLRATAECHRRLYPQDKILVVEPGDFKPAHRNAVLKKIRDGDFVAMYMAFSSFDMVVMSKEYWIRKREQRIADLERAAANASNLKERRMLQKEAQAQSVALRKFMSKTPRCKWMTFDELGVETLVVDEAHNYKNIALRTQTDNITGLHASGSKKCVEMLEKAHFVKKLILMTGTPLTNSLTDLFVFQQYLQPHELEFRGIDTLDTWINTFAERETNYEIDVDARHLRLVTRFSKFHNLSELLGMFSTVCDFYINRSRQDLPRFRGYEEVVVPRSAGQELYIDNLSARADAVHAHEVPRTQDNLLKITVEGRLCALDIREVDEGLYEADTAGHTKVDACADKVLYLSRKYPGTCQLVFSDIGTPKTSFNVYDALKQRLVDAGMPAHRIAFVHDATTEAAKTKLFAAMNKGEISVCIGSTRKLGTGVNVQAKLIALHHLDVPWKPADMIQREGRILRQGNTCEEVFIFHYVTEGTFDSFSWQVLEKKAIFLESFLSGIVADREADEIDDAVLRYSEIKALAIGNELIKQRVETANRLSRAKIAYRTRQQELHDLHDLLHKTPAHMRNLERLIAATQKDIELYAANRGAIPAAERLAFGEELALALEENIGRAQERWFDTYRGFDVFLPAGMTSDKYRIFLRSRSGGSYEVEMGELKPMGCSMRIDRLLEHLPEHLQDLHSRHADAAKRKIDAQINLKQGNPHEIEVEKLERALSRLDAEIKEKQEAEVQERMAKKHGIG